MEKVDSRDSARGRRRPTTSGRQTRRFLAGLLAVAVGSSVLAVTSSVSANVPTPSSVPGATLPHGLAWFTSLPGDQPFFFGNLGDVPLYADMDGDGREDPVVFRPSTGTWYWGPDAAGNATRSAVFGGPGDSPLLGDIDADGRANLVIYRPSTQQFIYGSQTGVEITRFLFGSPGDLPVMGTWIDGRTSEPGLLRPSSRVWYLGRTAAGGAKIVSPAWGNSGDIPLSAKWHGAGSIYPALYRSGTQEFFIGGGTPWQTQSAVRFGNPGDTPVFGDVNGDGYAETVVVRPAPLGNSFRVDSVATSWDQAGLQPANLSTVRLPVGVAAWVTVQVTNTGALPWRQADVELRTSSPLGRGSGFAMASWIDQTRVARPLESTVVSGGKATFRFAVSPQAWVGQGVLTESFTLVHVPTGNEMAFNGGQSLSVALGASGGTGTGTLESAVRQADGSVRVRGWAWSPGAGPTGVRVSIDNNVVNVGASTGVARPDLTGLPFVGPNAGFDFLLPSTTRGVLRTAAIGSPTDTPLVGSGISITPWTPVTTTTVAPTTTTTPNSSGAVGLRIGGSSIAGSTLRATAATGVVTYRWYSCASLVSGVCAEVGSGRDYLVKGGDVGTWIEVRGASANGRVVGVSGRQLARGACLVGLPSDMSNLTWDTERIDPIPGRGCIRINLFIQAPSVVWKGIPLGAGDARSFRTNAGVQNSRASIWVDFETGLVTAAANFSDTPIGRYPAFETVVGSFGRGTEGSLNSCGTTIVNSYIDPFSWQCQAARNQVVIAPRSGNETLRLRYRFITGANAALRGAGPDVPAIDGVLAFNASGLVCATRDSFPSIEVYRDQSSSVAGGLPSTVALWRKFETGTMEALGENWNEQTVAGGCGRYDLAPGSEAFVWSDWMIPWHPSE